uniref:Formamidopyrimidine-DNA glycosylase catalytic domain-containing protein n=1 Tax=Magallana gigas TaxID=29159 RepID=A0A8W8M3I3_MAGGI
MVEGPGCKIKGEKIKSKLMKQAVKAVSGNAVDREIKPKKGLVTSQFDVLIGRPLTGVQTLGKELFMYFGDVCLRVHFLMAGSFRVNGQALDKDFGKLTETPSLQVNFSTDVLTFYKSAAQIRNV